jgi:hypothetical protein
MHKVIDELASNVDQNDKVRVQPGETYILLNDDPSLKQQAIKYEF